MPDKYREDYSDFVERFWEAKQLWDDRPKLMLKTLPELSGVQSPVHLYTARTSYSVVRFYQDQMAEHDKQSALDELLLGDGTVRFAHSLSLHLIVVTADRRILLTHRSPGVGYRAQTWSVSIEEQLETADLGDASGEASMVNWYRRALTEELALVEGKHFDEDAIRVMSLFLESDLPNVAISAVTHVTVDSEELTAILRVKAPENEEFRSWAYLRADRPEVLRELLRPSRKYHPTSGYRLLCAYQRLFGWPTEADLDIATK